MRHQKQLQFLAAAAFLAWLAGCAFTSDKMEDDDGAVVDCSKWGVGLIGAPLALYRSRDCVKKSQSAGLHPLESHVPVTATLPAVPTAGTATEALVDKGHLK